MKTILALLFFIVGAQAHFLTLLPTSDNVTSKKESKLTLDAMFIHPFEQSGMTMEKPLGIYVNSLDNSLKLKETKRFRKKAWQSTYTIKKPGVYSFFVKPQAYFESSEGKYISHVPKVIVSAFGREDGWDKPLGLKYEIIPMVKPFALYSGNLFQGKVLKDGKPAANVEVEVELFNENKHKAPTPSHITQVVNTDENGVFSFVMNKSGWWGFAALIEEGEKVYEGKKYPIENGALLWIKAY